MPRPDKSIQECINLCRTCANVCYSTAMNHCLETGGSHIEPKHFRLMIGCAEVCRTSAQVMMLGIYDHAEVWRACSALCRSCAESCEDIGDLEDCVQACSQCAEACERMSTLRKAA